MNTKALRQKILDLAIHGKLVPQDPNDEPASVLLERIRAEKERLIKEGKIKKPKKSKATCDKPHYPFELPKEWEWCKLEELCCIKGGKRIPRGFTFSKSKTKHVYLRVTDMKECSIMLTDLKYIDDDVFEQIKNYTIDSNDLYLTIAGTIGSVGIIPQELSGMNLTENAAKLTNISCVKEYLLYALLSSTAQEHFTSKFHQVAQPKLSIETASTTPIALPPINEQIRIVSEIERTLKLIDGINNNKNELQTAIKQAKSKILDLAIHGKLVPQDPNDEPASELLKRINPKAEITCDNPQYGKLPKGWCLCHIPDVANTLLGKTLDRSKNTGTPKDYLCAINVLWGKFDFTTHKQFLLEKNEYERYAVMKGDLMVCEGGDVGRCAIWEDDSKEIYYQNALHRIRCKEGVFNYYILYLLWHYKLNGTIDYLCKGVTIKHFTQAVMNKLDILLPPFEEQKRIVAKIEEIFAQLGKIESSL